MINFIIFSILIIPWIVCPFPGIVEQFRMPKAVYFDIMCMTVIFYALKDGIKFQFKNKYLAYLTGYIFFTMFWNWYSPLIMAVNNQYQFNLYTIEQMIHFILGLTATIILCSMVERDDFVRFAKAICISSCAVGIIGVLQAIDIQPFPVFLHYTADIHVSAFMDNPNLVGNYLCLSIPFFLYLNKVKYYLMLIPTLLCLYFTQSDISQAVAGIGLILYLILIIKNKWITRGILLLVLLGLVFVYFNQDMINLDARFNNRFEVWSRGWDYFLKNPLFGSGLGIWKTFGIIVKDNMWFEAHNDWWERIIELGLVGLFLMLLLVFSLYRNFNYSKDNRLGFAYLTSFTMFLILMGGSFVMETAPVMLTGLLGYIGVERLKE